MADIIKFPYAHANDITIENIHEMVDCLPTINEQINTFMLIVTTESGQIYTGYDGKQALKCVGALEVLKNNILHGMDMD